MTFPERFSNLPEYAFPRLRALLDSTPAGGDVVHMSIGEPRHAMPDFVAEVLGKHLDEFAKYPDNNGAPDLLAAITQWLKGRFDINLSPDQLLTLNGTREGLYSAVMALCPETKNGAVTKVLIPNPFYQVYAVGTAAAGAEPVFVPALAENGFLPDFNSLPTDVLDQTAICFICSPSNPQGAIASRQYLSDLIDLAEKHDFKIFSDECYSEIYRDTPPPSALEIAQEKGADPDRVVIFHSLSKRSNMPGLRSGFAAGGVKSIAEMRKLRAYSGAPLPSPLQSLASHIWRDEQHVIASRELYRKKYEIADGIFAKIDGYHPPQAGFFLWLPVDDSEQATLKVWRETGVRVLPGKYLSRDVGGQNPGNGYIRVALVAEMNEMQNGLLALNNSLYAG